MYRKLFFGSLEAFSGAPTKASGGGFFYFSADEKYLIKSLDAEEFRAFFVDKNDSGRTFLQDYYERIVSAIDSKQPSLLCQFCGLHKLTSSDQASNEESYLVVMRNVFTENHEDKVLPYKVPSRIFDLKGSLAGRTNKKARTWCMGQESSKPCTIRNNTLKDIDFHELGETIRLSRRERRRVNSILKKDADFLSKQNVMDYSIVVGIYRQYPRRNDVGKATAFAFFASRRPAIIKSDNLKGTEKKKFLPPQVFHPDVMSSNYKMLSRMTKTVMKKKSMHPGFFNNWKDRVFELRNSFLVYYDTDKTEKVKKGMSPNTVFNLHYVEEVIHPSQSGRRHITIKFLSKHFHKDKIVNTALDIIAPTDKDAMIWATEIRSRTERLADIRKGIEFKSLSDSGRIDDLQLCDRHLRYVACDNSEEYRFGVIDLFTKWDLKKRSENAAKTLYNRSAISAVNPERYRDRFLNAIKHYYFADDAKSVRQSFRAPVSPFSLEKNNTSPRRRRRSQSNQVLGTREHNGDDEDDGVDLFDDLPSTKVASSSSSSIPSLSSAQSAKF